MIGKKTEEFTELSCRSKLATLSDKLNLLERKVEFLEARVTKGDTLS